MFTTISEYSKLSYLSVSRGQNSVITLVLLFLLSLSLMHMAFIYSDYLSVEHRPVYAVMWTLSGGAVTTVVFLSVYELGLLYRGVGGTTASIAAFLITVGLQSGSAILDAHIR